VVVVAGLTFAAVRFLKPRPPTTATVTDGQTTSAAMTKPPLPPPQPPEPTAPTNQPAGTPTAANEVISDPSLTNEVGTTGVSDTTGTPLDQARTYLPNPGFKYTYYCNYPDGDKGTESETVARPTDTILATVIRAVPGDGETIYFSEHYAQGREGVVRCWDDVPDSAESFMPDGLAVGKTWVEPGVQATVTAMNQPVDLGFVRFNDAMLVHYQYEADYEETMSWVPGYGVVLSETPGGLVAKKLTDVSAVDGAALQAIVAKHAPNASKVQ